jgi:uncharacterized coiled-coil protein SlyX
VTFADQIRLAALEASHQREIASLDRKLRRAQKEMAEVTRQNTERISLVADLTADRVTLEQSLNRSGRAAVSGRHAGRVLPLLFTRARLAVAAISPALVLPPSHPRWCSRHLTHAGALRVGSAQRLAAEAREERKLATLVAEQQARIEAASEALSRLKHKGGSVVPPGASRSRVEPLPPLDQRS